MDANSINCEFIKKKYKNFDNLLCINSLIDENNLDDLEFKVKKFIEEKHLTFLSVDIDSIDGLVSSHLAEAFKPLIIVVEINSICKKFL